MIYDNLNEPGSPGALSSGERGSGLGTLASEVGPGSAGSGLGSDRAEPCANEELLCSSWGMETCTAVFKVCEQQFSILGPRGGYTLKHCSILQRMERTNRISDLIPQSCQSQGPRVQERGEAFDMGSRQFPVSQALARSLPEGLPAALPSPATNGGGASKPRKHLFGTGGHSRRSCLLDLPICGYAFKGTELPHSRIE